jgi:hypothetical protein
MRDHIIVCGDDALARRIIDELSHNQLSVTVLQSPTALQAAGGDLNLLGRHVLRQHAAEREVERDLAVLRRPGR